MSFNIDHKSATKAKDKVNRQHLLEVMEVEHQGVVQLAEQFYGQEQFDSASDMGFCKKIIAAVNRVLAAGDWDSSLFLRNTIKPLRAISQQAQGLIKTIQERSGSTQLDIFDQLNEGVRLVFVSLFQADGHDLKSWAVQLRSIENNLSGRPVYAEEEQVQRAIRTSINQDSGSQAYVVIAIADEDIEQVDVSVAKPRKDRFGNDLLLLKSGVVTHGDIVEFVHVGNRYRFVNGRMFLQK